SNNGITDAQLNSNAAFSSTLPPSQQQQKQQETTKSASSAPKMSAGNLCQANVNLYILY
ncbi:unnamed protein product, partial [Rotaria sp. Silwood2]